MEIKYKRVTSRTISQSIQVLYTKINNFILSYNKILRFIVAGGIGAATDLALLYIFTDVIGLWYVLSAIFAFSASLIVSFILQKFWTFSDKRRLSISWQAPWYLCIALGNLIVNTLLVFVFVDYGHLHYLLAQIITSLIIAVSSFILYSKLFSYES